MIDFLGTGILLDTETTGFDHAKDEIIELEIFEKFKDRDRAELVQARKALTDHIFGLIAAGETDEQRLVVCGLAHLKSLEKMGSEEARKVGSHSGDKTSP